MQDGLGDGLGTAVSPDLPLEVADPEDQFRDLLRPALDLDAPELLGGDRRALDLQKVLLLAEVSQQARTSLSRRLKRSRLT